MKILNTSLAVGVLALVFTSVASATPTTIYIAGSNGDRTTSNTAIAKLLGGIDHLTFAGTSSYLKANFGVFTGGTFNGQPVTIKVAYIGATGGIAANAGYQTVNFVPDGVSGEKVPDPTTTGNAHDAHIPDFTLSTNFQSTSPFTGNYKGINYETLEDTLVAAIPLKWVASKGYPGNNLTTQQAQLLYLSGAVPLALFTGSSTDQHKIVYSTGRNTDAGQRYVALTEIGLGVNTVVKQYKPTISGTAVGVGNFVVGGTVDSQALYPIETFSGVNSQFLGNSGATTGAVLAPFLTATLSANAYKLKDPDATAGYYISYLTTGDADTIAIPNGAVELKWNGIPFSQDAVAQGQYTFWTYEHVLTRESLTGTARDFATALSNQILNTDGSVAQGILLSNLQVSRTGEGTIVTADYF